MVHGQSNCLFTHTVICSAFTEPSRNDEQELICHFKVNKRQNVNSYRRPISSV
jgi:hypothetical protein